MNRYYLLLYLSLVIFFIPIVIPTFGDNRGFQISCSTEGKLTLEYLKLNFIVSEDNSIYLSGSMLFEVIGTGSTLQLKIQPKGSDSLLILGEQNEVIMDVAFYLENEKRNYFIGPYSESYSILTTQNSIMDYSIDFSDNVRNAKNIIYPEGDINEVGVRGRLTFEIQIDDIVEILNIKRFFEIILTADANLEIINFDVSLPRELTNLVSALIDDQNMHKISPYRVDTNIDIIQGEETQNVLYFEWDMPETQKEVSLWTKIVEHPLFSPVLSLLFGSLFGRYVWKRISEKREKRQIGKKMILELEHNKKWISEHASVSETKIYDASIAKFHLFSDKATNNLTETYSQIKKWHETPVPVPMSYKNEMENIIYKIDTSINLLKTEISWFKKLISIDRN